jgi:hypothetical protein
VLVNDREEIDTGECRPSFPLCGHRLISPKVVLDSACVAQTFSYPFEGKSDSLRAFKRRDTHYLESQQGLLKAKADLAVISEATSVQRSCVASAQSRRDWDSHHTNLKKGLGFLLGLKAKVSAEKKCSKRGPLNGY